MSNEKEKTQKITPKKKSRQFFEGRIVLTHQNLNQAGATTRKN